MLKEEFVGLKIKDIDSSEELLKMMAVYLEKKGLVKDTFKKSLIEREKSYPTGLFLKNHGVSIPHTDAIHVNQDRIAIATTENPVIFKQMGGEDNVRVNVIFMLLLTNSENHLIVLQKLMEFFQNEDVLKEISNLKDTKESRERIKQYLKEFKIIN